MAIEGKYAPLSQHVAFDSTVMKWNKNGTHVLSDSANLDEGDKYVDMPASAASVDAPNLDDDGNPVESGDGSALDDPGSMTQFHTKQRFPVGTRTVHYYAYDAKYYLPSSIHGGSNYTTYHCHAWDLWEYKKSSITTTSFHKVTVENGFQFKLIASYNDYKYGGPSPSGEAQALARTGGYWYNGKKYP